VPARREGWEIRGHQVMVVSSHHVAEAATPAATYLARMALRMQATYTQLCTRAASRRGRIIGCVLRAPTAARVYTRPW
jgi:hypothetical protein